MNVGKKIRDGLNRARQHAALHGGPKRPEFSASDQFRWPDPAHIWEQPPRAGCPTCTAPTLRVHCGGDFSMCPMAPRNLDAEQHHDAAAGHQPLFTDSDQPISPPAVPEEAPPQPGQEPGFTLPKAASVVPWAIPLAKLALQAATWWRQAK